MTEKKQQNKVTRKGTIPFNHMVKDSSRKKVDQLWTAIEAYCEQTGYNVPVPQKGMFVSLILDESPILKLSPEEILRRLK